MVSYYKNEVSIFLGFVGIIKEEVIVLSNGTVITKNGIFRSSILSNYITRTSLTSTSSSSWKALSHLTVRRYLYLLNDRTSSLLPDSVVLGCGNPSLPGSKRTPSAGRPCCLHERIKVPSFFDPPLFRLGLLSSYQQFLSLICSAALGTWTQLFHMENFSKQTQDLRYTQ